jgi:putative membrane protein
VEILIRLMNDGAMKIVANLLVILVALLHLWFLTLEMFLWQKPLGLKTFKNTKQKADLTAVLAANQGLYNGFLAAGLFVSFCFPDPNVTFAFQVFFLICVAIAGVYGAFSFSRKILFIQAFPAILALVMVWGVK